MDNFKKAYIKLILKYPFTFVKERWCCFYNCVTKYSGTKTSELYTYNHDDLVYFREHYWLNQPINLEIRNHVVNYLEMKGLFACLKVLSIFIPQIIIVIGLNLYILLKNKLLFLAVLVYDLRIFLVFLTAPSWWHMYYYSVYTLGWMVGVGVIITLVDWIMNRFTMNKNVARSVKSGS